jgi:DNA mismatch repair protein MutS
MTNVAYVYRHEYENLPPMLQQYVDYKKRYPDALLLFQVGDFYETFFQDAITIAQVINLTLTSRDKNSDNPIPMAGVPISVVDGYVDRLVERGHSVALVSQVESKPPQGKGMVERKLDRLVTPGVRVLSRTTGDTGDNILVAAIMSDDGDGALAFTNVQSGIVTCRDQVALDEINDALRTIAPAEIVVTRTGPLAKRLPQLSCSQGVSIKIRSDDGGDVQNTRRDVARIEGYGGISPQAKRAVRLLLAYIDETTVESSVSISSIQPEQHTVMQIDAATRQNLEIVKNSRDGGSEGTLFGLLDKSATNAGKRSVRSALTAPLLQLSEIHDRLATVRFFVRERETRSTIHALLRGMTDLERVATRIELLSVTPRELGALRDALDVLPRVIAALPCDEAPTRVGVLREGLLVMPCEDRIRWFHETPPLASHEGGIFADGVHDEIDRLRTIHRSGRSWIDELELVERERTGISSLKIKSNNVIGYFFEVTKTHLAKIPEHFIRKQSTVQGERFTSDELRKRESELLSAESSLFILERGLFEDIRRSLRESVPLLRSLSRVIGELDMLLSFAEVSDREGYVEPHVDESRAFSITEAKHPVLSVLLSGGFIPNDIELSPERAFCKILTGPNMGGKSTYLRQSALIAIMAQAGCFVPAREAHIGIVDRIFARIGASDNMLEGESTFMVEMREASFFIKHATARSLLLIDELGRGTATADGVSLAHAILEWLIVERGCRTLFATHYHELTQLSQHLKGVANLSVGSEEHDGKVLFTHHIAEGPASKSYGIEVARIAGLPDELLERARGFVAHYASSDAVQEKKPQSAQLTLFAPPLPVAAQPKIPAEYLRYKEIVQELARCSVDDMTPREALQLLGSFVDRAMKR